MATNATQMRRAFIAIATATIALASAYFFYWKLAPVEKIRSDFAGLSIVFDDAVKVHFTFVLQNDGLRGCTLPASPIDFYVRSQLTNAMRNDTQVVWPTSLRLPREQRHEATVILAVPYSSEFTRADIDSAEKLKSFIDRKLSEVDGFYAQSTLQCAEVTMDISLKSIKP